ncbi:MAG: bifunctional hydroxymethylpyrimidine kinase/phosphomethylpyrimidine kinase [Clostridia bacterium]|nr:bifunctional hydroxymethylpyrimidine kinase/phosphomethylpyrimidine kinase [Clostridia bacterium]
MKTVLTVAGSDSSGGAGIQADLKTFLANGVYGMSAITALTAQNTMGVRSVLEVTPQFLQQQLEAVFEDIPPDAVKVGMVPTAELIETFSACLKQWEAPNLVIDPVMVSTSGSSLIQRDAVEVLKRELFPIATVITPNIPEAERLTGKTIRTSEDMCEAAKQLGDQWGCGVLVKGGHLLWDANDVLYCHEKVRWFQGKRIANNNTHGTGCTLSSAIAANLAKGISLEEAVVNAKDYISGALSAMLNLGNGSGPLHHGFSVVGFHQNSD